ncbi:hypothetical protein P3T76_000279 [Phytophthora citrophthora]|uniref:Fibronectin type-III domain-containing protein n=1 Tax=Phytophthora citrophthora TaxID=4793 RepID=A0AAD9H0B0_9STRA|nr:hypothetical protein P3T76_000279 [Phytophthora citrophthora]
MSIGAEMEKTSVDLETDVKREDNALIKVQTPVTKKYPLPPILPHHPVQVGALVVNKEETRVVYLAPLMSTSKEIYFAKHKELLKGNNNSEPCDEEQDVDESKNEMMVSLERHLAILRKAEQQAGSPKQLPTSSLFSIPSDTISRTNSPAPITAEADATSTDRQLKKMKQRVRLLPISDDDRTAFWDTIRGYERMRAYYHATVLAGGASTPMGFNMEAAFKKMVLLLLLWHEKLLDERHQIWVNTHEIRLEANKTRKVQEDGNYERRVLEASSEYRARQRLQKRLREQLICEAQNMQPIIMLSAFTQKMFNFLILNWSQRRLENHLSRTIRIWRQHRSIKRTNTHAAHLLIEWLQKSIAVKSVGFRVFKGLRIFIRRIKCVQGLWRKRQAIRKLKFLIVEKAWIELEAQYVDSAIGEYENKRLGKKSPKGGPNQKSRKKGDAWMRFVPDAFRVEVIHEFLLMTENEFKKKFRSQEIDFFPQLVQTLRGEHPNRARTYIRAVASQHALCGRVIETLLQYPGAVGDDVVAIEPFDVHLAPISELIQEGRTRCSNRPNSRSPNDEKARQTLQVKTPNESEEYKKQLALLLQRRQQLRQTCPATGERPPTLPPRVEVVADHIDDERSPMIPKQSFALVAVSYNFKNLPTLSEKTKDVAMSLFDSLVDQRFNRFSRRGSKLLLNPSVIEFQDTMKELKEIIAEEPNSSFFMCLSTHGARVTRGVNEGSYVLFSETRLSSEEELILTAIHEKELAKMISDIPCKSKFVALELCQNQEPKDAIIDDAETIRHRIHELFFTQLYKRIAQLRLQNLLDRGVRSSAKEEMTVESVQRDPSLFNSILVESCNVKTEVPVRANEERVSNFLLRFRDAFRGAAIMPRLEEENGFQQSSRPPFFVKSLLEYVCNSIRGDAEKNNAQVHAEYQSQVRTRYERAAEFQDITHTPSILGIEHAIDFGLGEIPEPPTVPTTPPSFITSTLNSITLSWNVNLPTTNSEPPSVLGYHIQRRGFGRACIDGEGDASIWKRAAAFQVLSYEDVVRNGITPNTTITVYGLATDTAYCFRARARTAGGWGPFSAPSPGYRTLSATSTLNQLETVRLSAIREGPQGIAKLMDKHKNIGAIQRYATEVLVRMAMTGASSIRGQNAGTQQLLPIHLSVVVNVQDAMLKFKKDVQLQQQGCILFGRLAQSSVAASTAAWRAALQSVGPPSILSILQGIIDRTERGYNTELVCCAASALEHIRAGSKSLRQKPWHNLSENDAAIRLQNLYRCRKARESARAMARLVYAEAIDPSSGMTYIFNTRTGATFWELPKFA